ncbi:hypothetical protein L345_01801, partial [Ophiophagus hannah]
MGNNSMHSTKSQCVPSTLPMKNSGYHDNVTNEEILQWNGSRKLQAIRLRAARWTSSGSAESSAEDQLSSSAHSSERQQCGRPATAESSVVDQLSRVLTSAHQTLADALSRLPQYNSTKKDVVNSIIPHNQIATPVPVWLLQFASALQHPNPRVQGSSSAEMLVLNESNEHFESKMVIPRLLSINSRIALDDHVHIEVIKPKQGGESYVILKRSRKPAAVGVKVASTPGLALLEGGALVSSWQTAWGSCLYSVTPSRGCRSAIADELSDDQA